MPARGSVYGKYKPCKWCSSKDTVKLSIRRVTCNDCGRATNMFSSNKYRTLTKEDKMNRPCCIKDKESMRSKGGQYWQCDICGVTAPKVSSDRMIRMMNLKAVKRPNCPYCGTPNPISNRNDWRCSSGECRKYWPKKPRKEQLPPQPIEEVFIT